MDGVADCKVGVGSMAVAVGLTVGSGLDTGLETGLETGLGLAGGDGVAVAPTGLVALGVPTGGVARPPGVTTTVGVGLALGV